MSILDRGRSVDVNDALKEIMKVVTEFYTDEFLDQKTELNDALIDGFTKLEYWDDLVKNEFGCDMGLTEKIKMRKMRKLVSRKRTGRTEAMQVLSTQLAQILMHPQTALRRLFGMGE
jgi:hypothetical protein